MTLVRIKEKGKDEIIAVYYHIQAKDLNEALEIEKSDPGFEDGKWRLEIRRLWKLTE